MRCLGGGGYFECHSDVKNSPLHIVIVATRQYHPFQRLIEAFPNEWCISELVNAINVSGVALTDGLNSSNVYCKYVFENGEEHRKFILH